MSNQIVGTIYQNVIDAVINECRDDFQENGIDEMTLQELKDGWQTKLSSLQVAQMPWDSLPEPETQEQLMYQPPAQPQGVPQPQQPSAPQEYGGMPSLHTPQNPGLVLPGSQHGQSGVKLEQTDGAVAEEPFVSESNEAFVNASVGASKSSVDTSKKSVKTTKSKTIPVTGEIENGTITITLPQTDGAEDDEDELNSDLDDSSDDNLSGNEDEDDSHGNTILCVYDRIHRVKNNRKFTFRDGIVNVNRKDYVFGRATGESEW
ncbi:Transcription initiation factor IIA large subunit [Yarrowia sp. B02]|nr:Transcription initiation factor IIA large subunit [Yarrowia sp. B02]